MTESGHNARYYFLCSYPLQSGSTVLPGNWGRILSKYDQSEAYRNDPNAKARKLREQVFEEVRLKEFPEKPSRLKSIFLCENIDGAVQFQRETANIFTVIYEVKIVQPDLPKFRADWGIVASDPQRDTILTLQERARQYWKGDDIKKSEILSMSGVEIIKRASD